MGLSAGTRLGPYEIQSSLGAGGMGEVYRARDTRLDRTVAIKVVSSDLSSNADLRDRFEREARSVAAINHPHICTLYDVGHDGDTAFLVMEYIEGETLAARLAKSPDGLPLPQALKIGIEIADALDRTHRAGITHRDLKPANIMLTRSGAKLLDFGLAKLRPAAAPISMSGMTRLTTATPRTASGTIIGTVHYMAPEQVEGREANERSDIWALGAVIFEMVTGRRPFEGESPASIIGAILKDVPPPVSARQRLAPPALDHLVERSLAKDAEERWQDAGDVKLELQWIARAAPVTQPTAVAARRFNWRWMVPAAAALVVVMAFAAANLFGPRAVPVETPRMVFTMAPPDAVRIAGASALSPDGRYFVFVGQATTGPASLWLRSTDTGAARALPDTDFASLPFWSPRSEAIGFFAGGRLKTVQVAGGPPKILADAGNGRGGSWGSDGTILYVPEPNGPLYRISEGGGASSAVTALDNARGHIGHRWPTFIDSRRFLFTVQGSRSDVTGIYFATLDAPAGTRLLNQYSNSVFIDGRILSVSENNLIVAQTLDPIAGRLVGEPVEVAGPIAFTGGLGFGAFSASSNGLMTYTAGTGSSATIETRWIDRSGKLLGQLGSDTDVVDYNAYFQRLSPDGRTIVMSVFRSATADLWLVDTTRDVVSRFTFDDATEINPAWSPDGTEILYSSNAGGFYNTYRQSISRVGEPRRVLQAMVHQYVNDWSRDGRTIVFTSVDPKAATKADIWAAPATGEGAPAPVVATAFNEYAARLSPDGQWIAYTSDESGRPEVYVQRFPSGGEKAQVSIQGGSEPQWRADGRELFYLAADRMINAVAVTTGASFAAGRPVRIFDAIVDVSLGSIHASHYLMTADGQRFLINVSAFNRAPTMVVANWASALKP